MKLSIEATDKLENKDFHYELTVSKTLFIGVYANCSPTLFK